MSSVKDTTGQEILHMRYTQFMNVANISQVLGIPETDVREFLEADTRQRIKEFKNIPEDSVKYHSMLVEVVKFLRKDQQRSSDEISKLLDLPMPTVYGILHDLARKSPGKNYSLSRDEIRKRDNEILRLNAEDGYTLETIGKMYNLSKQRISDIMRGLGHVPLNGNKIKALDRGKNISILSRKSVDTYNQKLAELGKEVRTAKQKLNVYRSYANKAMLELRVKIVELILDNWEDFKVKPVQLYLTETKYLRAALEKSKVNPNSYEYKLLVPVLSRCAKVDSQVRKNK